MNAAQYTPHSERGRVPIDPGSPASHGTPHGSAFSVACRRHHHEKTQVAGGERLCEGVEFLIAFNNDGVARDMFRLGHQPVLPYREGLTQALSEASATLV
jgi:hypothetical protein